MPKLHDELRERAAWVIGALQQQWYEAQTQYGENPQAQIVLTPEDYDVLVQTTLLESFGSKPMTLLGLPFAVSRIAGRTYLRVL